MFCSRECWTVYLLTVQVRYTGYRDRPLGERRLCLQSECREGHAPIVSGRHVNSNQISVLCDKNKTKVNHMQLHFQSDSVSVLCDLRTVLWSFLCTLNVDVEAKIPRKHFPHSILVTSSRGCPQQVVRVGLAEFGERRGTWTKGRQYTAADRRPTNQVSVWQTERVSRPTRRHPCRRVGRVDEDVTRMLRENCSRGIST